MNKTLIQLDESHSVGLDRAGDVFRELAQQGVQINKLCDAGYGAETQLINGKEYQITKGCTFTPYASVKPCSARCSFCSENLERIGDTPKWPKNRVKDGYIENLSLVVDYLLHAPLGLSLSGLEISDDIAWFQEIAEVLKKKDIYGLPWLERAAYSNGAGLVSSSARTNFINALELLRVERFEWSRHHFLESINQKIMRFRPGQSIQDERVFEKALKACNDTIPVTLICILQRSGVNNFEQVTRYLEWAQHLGIKKVIFRELSDVGELYQQNRTTRYIESQRVSIVPFVKRCLMDKRREPLAAVDGYYYWNAQFRRGPMTFTFERSDYGRMIDAHNSELLHKLVYFANGRLCADWHPDRRVIIDLETGYEK